MGEAEQHFDAKRFGERLLIARRRAELSQRELGTLAAVHHITIARLERGRMPHVSVEVVLRLADALQVTFGQLIGHEEMDQEDAGVAVGFGVEEPHRQYYQRGC